MVFDYKIIFMQKQYNVQQEILKGILSKLFNSSAVNQEKNLSLITDIMFRELKESALEAVTHLMLTERTFVPTKIGDYVRVIPPKYHEGSEFEVDVLQDMGLLGKGDEYSPIKVDLMYHDENKVLKHTEASFSPLHALHVQKRFIPFLKDINQTELKFQENGKDINGVTA
jgi:hypothetical protein